MLVLFAGKSRACCRFLQGRLPKALQPDISHFETFYGPENPPKNQPFALT